MRKLALLGLLVVLTTGCGRGWLPLYRGASCRSGCQKLPPAAPAAPGCNNCDPARTMGYSDYEGEIVGEEYYGGEVLSDDYYGGTIVSPGVVTEGTIIEGNPAPPMSPITGS